MPVNIKPLETLKATLSTGTTNLAKIMGYESGVNDAQNTNTVSTSASLPDASLNKGRLFYVQDTKTWVFSNGLTWAFNTIAGVEAYKVFTWGRNAVGQLGDGTTTSRSSPGTIAGGGGTWNQVTIGGNSAAAIKTDGTLWTWGSNGTGQLGDGNATTISRSSPGTPAGGGTTWSKTSGGTNFFAAIKTDGTLWTWGYNAYGMLGTGNVTDRSSPGTTAGGGSTWSQLSCGLSWVGGVKTDGTLWMWGRNNQGQLGDATVSFTSVTSPITTAGGGNTWSLVSCGLAPSATGAASAGIKTDGTLWTWGNNDNGMLGDGTLTLRSSPVTTAGGGNTWSQVSVGTDHMVGLKTDGTLWVWGRGRFGQLGTGSSGTFYYETSPRSTAGGGTNWSQVSAGQLYSAAVKTDGTLWTWGVNGYGQLGDGTQNNRLSPGTTAGGGTTWYQVSAGYSYATIGLRT